MNKHPQKMMVLGIVGSDGQKCPIIFIDSNEKINRPSLRAGLLDTHMIPWIKAT